MPQGTAKARHIVLDSTGLKVFGEGEWSVVPGTTSGKVKKHGAGYPCGHG